MISIIPSKTEPIVFKEKMMLWFVHWGSGAYKNSAIVMIYETGSNLHDFYNSSMIKLKHMNTLYSCCTLIGDKKLKKIHVNLSQPKIAFSHNYRYTRTITSQA